MWFSVYEMVNQFFFRIDPVTRGAGKWSPLILWLVLMCLKKRSHWLRAYECLCSVLWVGSRITGSDVTPTTPAVRHGKPGQVLLKVKLTVSSGSMMYLCQVYPGHKMTPIDVFPCNMSPVFLIFHEFELEFLFSLPHIFSMVELHYRWFYGCMLLRNLI